jgi:hypothetical protein
VTDRPFLSAGRPPLKSADTPDYRVPN